MEVLYKLDTFEGPLDLLLHLIDEAEVDIYDIPIHKITEQYMEYISTIQALELEVTSEFLVMASTLLKIKSQMLLPKPPVVDMDLEDEDYDPRAELVAKLLEYRRYKEMAAQLREKELERSQIFTRTPLDLTPYAPAVKENPLKGIHLSDLMAALQKTLHRSARRKRVTKIERDEISVKECMQDVLHTLRHRGGRVLFSRLFDITMGREMLVSTFMALLELMKRKQVSCFQYGLFEDIVIELKEGAVPNEDLADEISD